MAAWQRHNNDLIPFPTPWQGINVYYPNLYPGVKPCFPFDLEPPSDKDVHDWKGNQIVKTLMDKSLADHAGDLGWNLDYATAWCYKHLIDNRLDIVDVVNVTRQVEEVDMATPFQIFDALDRVLFRNRLRSMVYLEWSASPSCSSGITSAPGVVGSRITIQLNSTAFIYDDADIEDLLEALIHHMIHAFFLVCCGAQKKGDKQDGRLLDGLHFGVILLTIKDITEECEDGSIPFIFHASKRRQDTQLPLANSSLVPYGVLAPRQPYISMDPRGRAVVPPTLDGQTHCLHDNRNISPHHLKNWQVQEFSRALDLDQESKGDEIWDFDKKGKLAKNNRLSMACSATYAELIWDGKFVMVSREKALAFKGLEKALRKGGSYQLKVPKCKEDILKCVHDYIHKGEYDGSSLEDDRGLGRRLGGLHGPPIIAAQQHFQRRFNLRLDGEPKCDALTHIRVFKTARDLDFEELMTHAIKRLSVLPVTNDDPIAILHEIYDLKANEMGPASVHPLLYKFAHAFLSATDDDDDNDYAAAPYPAADAHARHLMQHRRYPRALSNYDKISRGRRAEFEDLYLRSPAFRDDVHLVTNRGNRGFGHDRHHGLGLDLLPHPANFMALEEVGYGVGVNIGDGLHDRHEAPLDRLLGWGRRDDSPPPPLRLAERVDRVMDGIRLGDRGARRDGDLLWEEARIDRRRGRRRYDRDIIK